MHNTQYAIRTNTITDTPPEVADIESTQTNVTLYDPLDLLTRYPLPYRRDKDHLKDMFFATSFYQAQACKVTVESTDTFGESHCPTALLKAARHSRRTGRRIA